MRKKRRIKIINIKTIGFWDLSSFKNFNDSMTLTRTQLQ